MKKSITILFAVIFSGYTVNAQDPAFDDFERSTGLGSNWTNYGGSDIGIVANSDLGILNSPTRMGIVDWTGSIFAADQYSEAVISPDKIDSLLTQVYVRRRTSDAARYGFHWGNDNTAAEWAIKYDGVPTAQTRVLAFMLSPTPPAPGDILRIEVRTDTATGYPVIKGFHNGNLLLTAIDSGAAAIQNGTSGMAFRFRINFPAVYPAKAFEEWNGGSLPATTGVEEPISSLNSFIYPNPAKNEFYVQGKSSSAVLELYDITGRKVLSENIASNNQKISVEGCPQGIYFFKLITNGYTPTIGKIVIN